MSEETESTSGPAPRSGFSAGRTPNTPMDPVMKGIHTTKRRIKPHPGVGAALTPGRFLKRKCPPGMSLRAFARQCAGDGEHKDALGTFSLGGSAVRWMTSKKIKIQK